MQNKIFTNLFSNKNEGYIQKYLELCIPGTKSNQRILLIIYLNKTTKGLCTEK